MTKHPQYKRGGKRYYAALALASHASRIRRHIEVEVCQVHGLRADLTPRRKRETDAGYDVMTPMAFALAPGQRIDIDLGIKVNCPPGYFYEMRGRSSLNIRLLSVMDNVIDATYTGNLRVTVHNESALPVAFKAGDRIAQLIFLPQIHVTFKHVKRPEDFTQPAQARGDAGYGSTGQ